MYYSSHLRREVVSLLFFFVGVDAVVRPLEWVEQRINHDFVELVWVAMSEPSATRRDRFVCPCLITERIGDNVNQLVECDA